MNQFELIYNEYFSRIYAFLFKICRNVDLCEELAQETFYQAFKSFHRYDGSCEIFTWLAAVAKNTYLKYLRKNKIKTVDIELFISNLSAPPEDAPDFILQKTVIASIVKASINKLPEKYRDVLILRIYGELSFLEISKKLNISENSAKVIFHRAKNSLKEDLLNDEL